MCKMIVTSSNIEHYFVVIITINMLLCLSRAKFLESISAVSQPYYLFVQSKNNQAMWRLSEPFQ